MESKYDTDELTYETETDSQRQNRFVVAIGEDGVGERKDWDFGIRRCKALYIG